MAGSFKSCLSHPALHGTTRLDKQRPRGALTWLPRLYHFEKGTLFLIQISWRLFWIQTDRAPFKYPRAGYYNTKGFWRRASWISLPSRIIKKQKKKEEEEKEGGGEIIIVQRWFSILLVGIERYRNKTVARMCNHWIKINFYLRD